MRLFPHHDYADNAQYWLGECFYDQQRYDQAAPEFRAVLTRWPTGNKAPDAMLKLGFSLIALGEVDKGGKVLRDVPADLSAHRSGAPGVGAAGAADAQIGGTEVKRLMLVAGLVAGACATARAQTPSDLPTTETQNANQAGLPTVQTQPEPAPDQPRAYYPGMPLPPPPTEAGAPQPGGKEPTRQGLILNDEDRSSDYEGGVSAAPGGPPGEVPDTHVVQKGDTLWDLSSRYYRNAWGWPKLWSYNPQITNPHWIYPGDLIRLLPPGGGAGAGADGGEGARCRPRASPAAGSARAGSSCGRTASSSRASWRRRARSSAARKRS